MADSLDQIELFAGEHAIEVANFVVAFATPLDQTDMRRFEDSRASLVKLFPAINRPSTVQLPLPPMGQIAPQAVEFIHPAELLLFGGDGRPIWTGQFGGDTIAVSCRAYTTWSKVWSEAEKRLKCLAQLVDPHRLVRALDYSVTDTFLADTEAKALHASQIFEATRLVPAHLNGYDDPRWNFSQGWFENVDGLGTVLVRIGGRGAIQGAKTSVSIDNTHSHRPEPCVEMGALVQQLAGTFARFHDMNKALLGRMLKRQLLTRMGLQGNA